MPISYERQEVLKLLADYVNERSTAIDLDVKWEEVYKIACQQQIQAIIYYQAKNDMPQDIINQFASSYYHAVFVYSNRLRIHENIIKEFLSKNISFATVKGLLLADLYPEPVLRTMGDMDIFVDPTQMEKAHDAMMQLGYEVIEKGGTGHWEYSAGTDILIELHDQLVYDHDPGNSKKHVDFFNGCWDYIHDGTPEWEFHFLFLLVHMRKHMINAGIGLRQFFDIAVVEKYGKLNWNEVSDKAKELGLYKFMGTVFAFTEKWFGIVPPLDIPTIDETFYEYATNCIFENGVFGYDNEINRNQIVASRMINENGSFWKMRILFLLKEMFPKYERMKELPYCSYLKSRFLLPFAWLHRIFYRLLSKENRNTFLSKVSVQKDEAESRVTMLKMWGIE